MEENKSFSMGQSPKALGKLTKRCERTRAYAPDGYGRMRMSPDGRFVALNNGILWNLEDDAVVFEKEEYWLNGGFTADSRFCLMARQEPRGMKIYDDILLIRSETGEIVKTYREKSRCLVLDPKGQFFLTAFEEAGKIRFSQFQIGDGKLMASWSWPLKNQELIPKNLYLAENGQALYAELGSLRFYRDCDPCELLKFRLDSHESLFTGRVETHVSPQSFTEENIVTEGGPVLDTATGRKLRDLPDGAFGPVALLTDGITAVFGVEFRECEGSGIKCYNIQSGEKIGSEIVWMDPLSPFPVDVFPREIAVSSDGRRVLYIFQVNGRTKASCCEIEWLYE